MECLTEDDYRALAQSRLDTNQFEVINCKVEPLDHPGITVLAEFSVLKVSVQLKESGDLSELSFIVKTLPTFKANYVLKLRAFYKEPIIYNKVFKAFNNQTINKLGPECFLARTNEVIVLDNLYDLGFKKVDIKREFNLQHCELTLEALAKLHASSLILEETKSTPLPDLYPEVMFETVFSDETDHPGFDFMCTAINTLEQLISTHFTHFPKSVCKDALTLMRNLPFKLKPSVNYRNVLCHGNVWADNVLFSYGIDGQLTDVRLTDFSNARYTPPACDILLFLHNTTSRAFREIHQGSLTTLYYSNLAKEVQAKGFDLGELLPWSEFESSCEYYLGASVVGALMNIHLTLLPEDCVASLSKDSDKWDMFMFEDRSEAVLSAYSYDEGYRRRVSQTLIQCLEYCQFKGRRRSSVYFNV